MTPERQANLRKQIAEAYAKGARPETNGIYLPVSMGELVELLDRAERYDSRTSELLANCNRWEQSYRDVKSSLAAAITFAKHAAAALGQDYYP